MGIRTQCENCGYKYHLKDELAGKNVKCKICNATFLVPALSHDIVTQSPSGIRQLHMRREKRNLNLPSATSKRSKISGHIGAGSLGKFERVRHEIVSELVHVDVYWVKASSERPYHVLVTSGMSDRPMTVPAGSGSFPSRRTGHVPACRLAALDGSFQR